MMPNVHNISSQQRAFLLQQQQQQRNLQMHHMQQGMVSQQMPLQRQRGPNAPRINARDAPGARPMIPNGVGALMPQMSQPANATSEKSKMQPQAEARNRIAQRGQHIRSGSSMTPQNQPMGRAMPRNVRMQGVNAGNFQQQQMMPNNVMNMHMTPGMAPHGYPQQRYANSYQQMQRGQGGNSGARGPVHQGPRGSRSMMNVQSQKSQSSKPNPPAPAKAKTNFLLEAVRQKVERERKEEEAKLKAQKEKQGDDSSKADVGKSAPYKKAPQGTASGVTTMKSAPTSAVKKETNTGTVKNSTSVKAATYGKSSEVPQQSKPLAKKLSMQEEVLAQLRQKEKEAGGDELMWEKKKEDLLQKRRERSSSKDNTNIDAVANSLSTLTVSSSNKVARPSSTSQIPLTKAMGMPSNSIGNKPSLNGLPLQQKRSIGGTSKIDIQGNSNKTLKSPPFTPLNTGDKKSSGTMFQDNAKNSANQDSRRDEINRSRAGNSNMFRKGEAAVKQPRADGDSKSSRSGLFSKGSIERVAQPPPPSAPSSELAKEEKSVPFQKVPGWETKAEQHLIPLVKDLGGGLKSKSISTTLVKLGYERVIQMLNTGAILKQEFTRARAGPANANLLSRIGQSRTRVPVPQPSFNQNQGGRGGNKKSHRQNNLPAPTGNLPKLPPPCLGQWVPKTVDPKRVKSIDELRAVCEESQFCREKPIFLMGLIFVAVGPKRKPSRRQRAIEQIMNKPLKRIENAWKPNSKNAKKTEDAAEHLTKKLNSSLNKLTRENFVKIVNGILELKVENQKCLETMVDLVFEKAIMQAYLGDVYADLCVQLSDSTNKLQESLLKVEASGADFFWNAGENLKGEIEKGGPFKSKEEALKDGKRSTNFKRLLLTKCQNEFMNEDRYEALVKAEDAEAEKKREELTEDEKRLKAAQREQERKQIKKKMLGNINLIGELYKKEMLPSVALKGCFEKLLPPNNNSPEEDSIEMCCKLLTSVGPKLDGFEERGRGKKNKKKKDKKKKSSLVTPELIESYYTELLRIKQLKVLPARVNFQILDLIDLRKSRWKHRREQVVAKTKDEIKRDFEREERQKNADNRRSNRGGGRSKMGSGDIRGGARSGKPGDYRGGSNRSNNRVSNDRSNINRRGSGDARGGSNSKNSRYNDAQAQKRERPKLKLLRRSSSVGSVDSNSVPKVSPPVSPVEGNSLNVKVIASSEWPKEKIDRDLDSSLSEYLAITQVDELALNLKDLKEKSGASNIGASFTMRLFNLFLDKKDADRQSFTQLMVLLLGSKADSVKGLFSKEDFPAGLTSFAAELPDLKYDAPKCDER